MPRFDVLTLHPEMVTPFLTCSILGRAVDAKAIEIGVIDIRDHAQDRHRSVDAAPYGGGPGMVCVWMWWRARWRLPRGVQATWCT
jgi:tRNA (guanine37-N1)-methyltransferase